MPQDTFYNLPETKKSRVIEAALDEFSEYTYYKASISRIVERADIAKGSFYQYFEDKTDLFNYLIGLIIEQKMDYLQEVLKEQENKDFFQLLQELYEIGIKFARDHPRLNEIGNKLYKNKDRAIFEEIMEHHQNKSIDFFKNLLKKGRREGAVDEKIDIEFTAHILTSLNIFLSDFLYENGDISEEYLEIIDKMLYIIENGIKKK